MGLINNIQSNMCGYVNKSTTVLYTIGSILSLICCWVIASGLPILLPGGLIVAPIFGLMLCVCCILSSVLVIVGSGLTYKKCKKYKEGDNISQPIEKMNNMSSMYVSQSDNPFPPGDVMKAWNKAEYESYDPDSDTPVREPANKNEFIYGSTYGI